MFASMQAVLAVLLTMVLLRMALFASQLCRRGSRGGAWRRMLEGLPC